MRRDKAAVMAANLVLGYPENDLSTRVSLLPSIVFLVKRGLKSPADLDLSFYPTYSPANFLNDFSSFEKFAKKVDPGIDNQSLQILWRILSGESRLELRFKTKGGQVLGIPRFFEDNGKPVYRLPDELAQNLSRFFEKLERFTSFSGRKDQPKPFDVLINYTRQRESNVKLAFKLALQYISKPLDDLDADIKKLSAIEELEYFPEKHTAFLKEKYYSFVGEIKKLTAGQTITLDDFDRILSSGRSMVGNQVAVNSYRQSLKDPLQRKNHKFILLLLKIQEILQKTTGTLDEQKILIDVLRLKANETYQKSSIWVSRSITPSDLKALLFSAELGKSI